MLEGFRGEREHVVCVIQREERVAGSEGEEKPFIEPPHHVLMALSPEARVHVHREGVQLLQGLQRSKENDDESASFHLNRGIDMQ